MKRPIHDFIKYNRSTPFNKWMVVISYILVIFAFVAILLLLSDKQYSGLLLILVAILLGVYFFMVIKIRSLLKPWTDFGGAKMKNDDYAAAKTEPYKFSKEASAAIESLARENGMTAEDYLLTLVRHEALLRSGYTSLTEYLNNTRQGNDRITASEDILKNESKRAKKQKNKGIKE